MLVPDVNNHIYLKTPRRFVAPAQMINVTKNNAPCLLRPSPILPIHTYIWRVVAMSSPFGDRSPSLHLVKISFRFMRISSNSKKLPQFRCHFARKKPKPVRHRINPRPANAATYKSGRVCLLVRKCRSLAHLTASNVVLKLPVHFLAAPRLLWRNHKHVERSLDSYLRAALVLTGEKVDEAELANSRMVFHELLELSMQVRG
jgi:hypothetical protein